MSSAFDPALQAAIQTISLPGIVIGHRLISPGDENALRPDEISAFASSATKVRRASGAARIIARELLGELGHVDSAVPKAPSGTPIWPPGVVGSLAHDDRVAVAAVGRSYMSYALGIDVEPAEILPPELLDIVATRQERLQIHDDPYEGRLLFAAKEAVYKAVFPLDHTFLDHHDIEVNMANHSAVLRNGRVVDLRFCIATHLIVLAFLRARP
jgi:4'-phosphopantetheinyl transferase EntD